MTKMTIAENIEILIILLSGFSAFSMANFFSEELGVGRLLLYASALLLLQGLVRDLSILSRSRNEDKQKPQSVARCMCIESTVGTVGILIGILLLGLGIDRSVTMTPWTWTIIVMVVLGVGFFIKDFVFEWSPWRVYKDKDHMNIVFTWKT